MRKGLELALQQIPGTQSQLGGLVGLVGGRWKIRWKKCQSWAWTRGPEALSPADTTTTPHSHTHTHTMAALHTALVVTVHHCYFSTADGQTIWAPFPTSNSWFLNCSQYYKKFRVLLFSPYSSTKIPIQIAILNIFSQLKSSKSTSLEWPHKKSINEQQNKNTRETDCLRQ